MEKQSAAEKKRKEDLEHLTQNQVAISRRKLGGEAPIVVTEITTGCLFCGMYGTLDSARIKSVVDLILATASTTDTNMIIIDLSNVDVIDSAIANQLVKINKTLYMVGMDAIYCGIRPVVAQSMVNSGVEIDLIDVEKNLKAALKEVYRRMGLELRCITTEN